MGEERASGESRVGNFNESAVFHVKDEHLPTFKKGNHLHSFDSDKLKSVHNSAVSYNKCKFDYTLEVALMIRSRGEINV